MWVLESELGVTTDYLFLTAWLSTQLLRRCLMLRCENNSSPFRLGNRIGIITCYRVRAFISSSRSRWFWKIWWEECAFKGAMAVLPSIHLENEKLQYTPPGLSFWDPKFKGTDSLYFLPVLESCRLSRIRFLTLSTLNRIHFLAHNKNCLSLFKMKGNMTLWK